MPPREKPPQFSDDRPQIVTNRNIAIPLYLSISITASFVTVTIYFMTMLNGINSKLDSLSADRWRLSHQRQWKYDAEKINDGKVKFPDPDDIVRRLSQ